VLTWRPKIHPLLIFLIGGAVFVGVRALSGVHAVI
jgi:hypothetical protein